MLGDPFGATLEAKQRQREQATKGILDTFGLLAEEQQREKLLEKEAQLKQQYKDPLEALKDTLEIEKIKKELSGEITDEKTLNRATTLRKEFNTDQVYKNFQVVQRSEDQMKEAYNLATSPDVRSRVASDQAILVTFQKMLDPQSVVRESEYARTPEGISAINRMSAFADRIQKGGAGITDEDRLAVIQTAGKVLKASKRQMNSHIKRYKSLAGDYRVPPKLILGDIDEFDVGRTFMLNGEPYDIPDSEVDEFLKENPLAEEIQ